MDSARWTAAAVVTIGAGVALGLAANPTMRTHPELDWRTRYRVAAAPQQPAPQPGVSYYGDGSTAWAFGGVPRRLRDDALPPVRLPVYETEAAPYSPSLPPAPDWAAADDGRAERAAAQAVVASAVARSAPRDAAGATVPGAGPDDRQPGGMAEDQGAAAAAAAADLPPGEAGDPAVS